MLMNRFKVIFKIVIKHNLIIALILAAAWISRDVFNLSENLMPGYVSLEAVVVILFLISIFISIIINSILSRSSKNISYWGFVMIFSTWILTFYFKTMVTGILSSFEWGPLFIIDVIISDTNRFLPSYITVALVHSFFRGKSLSNGLMLLKEE